MCISFQQSAFLQLITSTLPACLQNLQSIVCHRSSDQFGGGLGTWWAKWRPISQSWWRSTWGSRPRRPRRPPRPSFCTCTCHCFCLGLKHSTQLIIFSASSTSHGIRLGGKREKGSRNASRMVQVSFCRGDTLTRCWIGGWLSFCGSGKFGGYGWSILVQDVRVAEYLGGLIGFVGLDSRLWSDLWVVAECSVSEQQRSRLAGVCVDQLVLKQSTTVCAQNRLCF